MQSWIQSIRLTIQFVTRDSVPVSIMPKEPNSCFRHPWSPNCACISVQLIAEPGGGGVRQTDLWLTGHERRIDTIRRSIDSYYLPTYTASLSLSLSVISQPHQQTNSVIPDWAWSVYTADVIIAKDFSAETVVAGSERAASRPGIVYKEFCPRGLWPTALDSVMMRSSPCGGGGRVVVRATRAVSGVRVRPTSAPAAYAFPWRAVDPQVNSSTTWSNLLVLTAVNRVADSGSRLRSCRRWQPRHNVRLYYVKWQRTTANITTK